MTAVNLEDGSTQSATPALWRLAFRPFFLGGALFSIAAISLWAGWWVAPFAWAPHGGPLWWHGHEMVFGFAVAIVVGFLLTAEQTWTGVPSLRGRGLFLLALLWLAGRLAILGGGYLPSWLVALVDVAFLPAAAVCFAGPVIAVRQWRNLPFAALLLVLAVMNGASHWWLINGRAAATGHTIHGAIMVITLIMAIVGGRVIPFFTARATQTPQPPVLPWLEGLSLGSLVLIAAAGFMGFDRAPAAAMVWLCALAALVNGIRCLRWGVERSLRIPLLWSLHLSYAFIPIGLLGLALYHSGHLQSLSPALHCFTAGAMGGLILAMMSRVSLGHTGRPMQAPRVMPLAFAAIFIGGLVRVGLPLVSPALTGTAVWLAAVLWIFSYGLFCFCYGPMLWQPRADGRMG